MFASEVGLSRLQSNFIRDLFRTPWVADAKDMPGFVVMNYELQRHQRVAGQPTLPDKRSSRASSKHTIASKPVNAKNGRATLNSHFLIAWQTLNLFVRVDRQQTNRTRRVEVRWLSGGENLAI